MLCKISVLLGKISDNSTIYELGSITCLICHEKANDRETARICFSVSEKMFHSFLMLEFCSKFITKKALCFFITSYDQIVEVISPEYFLILC